MGRSKKTKQISNAKKTTQNVRKYSSTANSNVIWVYDKIDKNGEFAFDVKKIVADNNLENIFEKMLGYETMTWQEVESETHDRGKSKHHMLDSKGLSKETIKRIKAMKLEEDTDNIFSFALTNILRIIGIKDVNGFFHVKWYDPNHKFYSIEK